MNKLRTLIVELMQGKGQEHLNKSSVEDYINEYERKIREAVEEEFVKLLGKDKKILNSRKLKSNNLLKYILAKKWYSSRNALRREIVIRLKSLSRKEKS